MTTDSRHTQNPSTSQSEEEGPIPSTTDAASPADQILTQQELSLPVLPLPVLPLPDGVVFPDMVVTISIQTDEAEQVLASTQDGQILLVPRYETDGKSRFARVGVIATIEDRSTLPDGTPAVTVRGQQRARVGTGVIGATSGLWVQAEPIVDPEPTEEQQVLAKEYRAAASTLLQKLGGHRLTGALREIHSPGSLADSVAYWPELSIERRITLLETIDVTERLSMASAWVKQSLAEIELQERIQKEVSDDLAKGQKDAILRRQMAAIQAELDDGEDSDIEQYRRQLGAISQSRSASESTVQAITKEIDRLERSGPESMESSWIRTWLDSVFDLPWTKHSPDRLDLEEARSILEADHTGLVEVKDRLIEFLAVRKLRAERTNAEADESAGSAKGLGSQRGSGAILALVGPPGVGKTSLGESVARSLGREFVRVALGGIRDEAEIRGHRRTYVGARPGRIVRAITEAGTMNPVILLDEIDKLGGGIQGDPSSALLEVLDPAQNQSFRDHYLEFDLDLSEVVFIATANVLDSIPGPLLDRLEVIRLDGYTEHEKATIAERHLLPRLKRSNGLAEDEIEITSEAIRQIVGDYTRDSGVRRLERTLDKILRKSATRIATGQAKTPIVIEPGQLREILGRPIPTDDISTRGERAGTATGLAVTGAGGDVLLVETALIEGEGEPMLTGQLGDVMKESAALARSVAGSGLEEFSLVVPAGKRLHIHFPAGSIPKDGPSAGVTMTTAMVSLLTGRSVRPEVAMTGEISLQGRVLPIGGVKQKVLAADRAGITEVILPHANEADIEDIPSDVLERVTIHLVKRVDEVLAIALAPNKSAG